MWERTYRLKRNEFKRRRRKSGRRSQSGARSRRGGGRGGGRLGVFERCGDVLRNAVDGVVEGADPALAGVVGLRGEEEGLLGLQDEAVGLHFGHVVHVDGHPFHDLQPPFGCLVTWCCIISFQSKKEQREEEEEEERKKEKVRIEKRMEKTEKEKTNSRLPSSRRTNQRSFQFLTRCPCLVRKPSFATRAGLLLALRELEELIWICALLD